MSITTPPRTVRRRPPRQAVQETPRSAAPTKLLDRQLAPERERTPLVPKRHPAEGFRPSRNTKFQRPLGSKQVISVRGRRVAPDKNDPRKIQLATGVIICFIATVIAAMLLSGKSTEQAFELQKLSSQETELNNQLETLNRDVEAARSSAEIARQAADKKLVVPDQPGVLAVENNGAITEQRPSDPAATRPIIDVNGAQVRPNAASSNPQEIKEIADNVESIPQQSASVPGVAPYAPRARDAQPQGMGQGAR